MEKTRVRNFHTVRHVGLFSCLAVCIAFVLGVGTVVHAAPVAKIYERTGVYVGEADRHTVAITTAGQEWCYQLQASAHVSLKGIGAGDKVWMEYKEVKFADGVTQLILTKIKKISSVGKSGSRHL
jgi:hypothetical protein